MTDPLSSGKGTEGVGPNPGSLLSAVAVARRKGRPTEDALTSVTPQEGTTYNYNNMNHIIPRV